MSIKKVDDLKKILLDLNDFLLQLDETIRHEAFKILASRLIEEYQSFKDESDAGASGGSYGESESRADFYGRQDTGKPHENVEIIIAWTYSQYGLVILTNKYLQ